MQMSFNGPMIINKTRNNIFSKRTFNGIMIDSDCCMSLRLVAVASTANGSAAGIYSLD